MARFESADTKQKQANYFGQDEFVYVERVKRINEFWLKSYLGKQTSCDVHVSQLN